MKKLFYLVIILLTPLFVSAQQLTHQRAPFLNNDLRDSAMKVLLPNVEMWRQTYNKSGTNQVSPLLFKKPDNIPSNSNEFSIYSANFQQNKNSGWIIDSMLIFSVNSTCDIAVLFSRQTGNNKGQLIEDRNILKWKKINNEWVLINPQEEN